MKATELIGCDVYDSRGEHLGHVHDLRFEADGEPGPTWQCRLTGLACGRSSIGHRLGYGTGDMAGPWPISVLFRRRHGRRLEIDWRAVERVERPTITLRATRAELERNRS
jgi:sporulation protein YlmC with PRC-barrel domain